MPTNEQAQACLRLCQMLSTDFQPIHLFRYDREMQVVYVLAGVTDAIEVIVDPNGKWRFADE